MTISTVRPTPRFVEVATTDHVIGPASAPVTLLMYGNYECLHCRRAYPAVAALRAELGARLRFVHRHFAISADFPHAEMAAEAAESAAAHGKFWEMHEALSLHAPFLDEPALLAEAARIGFDIGTLAGDLDARRYQSLVRSRTTQAIEAGVWSTPTFFVNGAHFEEAWDLESLGATLRRLGRA